MSDCDNSCREVPNADLQMSSSTWPISESRLRLSLRGADLQMSSSTWPISEFRLRLSLRGADLQMSSSTWPISESRLRLSLRGAGRLHNGSHDDLSCHLCGQVNKYCLGKQYS